LNYFQIYTSPKGKFYRFLAEIANHREPKALLSYSLTALQILVEKIQNQGSGQLAFLSLLEEQVKDWFELKKLSSTTLKNVNKLDQTIEQKGKKFQEEFENLKRGEVVDQPENGGPPAKQLRLELPGSSSSIFQSQE
jgi:hypothetical protein